MFYKNDIFKNEMEKEMEDLQMQMEQRDLSALIGKKNGKWNRYPDADIVVSNFPEERLPLYSDAVKGFNNPDLYIRDDAYDVNGKPLAGYKAICIKKEMDLSKFWRIVEDSRMK